MRRPGFGLDRVAELRKSFDDSFAAPSADGEGARGTDTENLLAIRVAAMPYSLRLRDISGIALAPPVVRLPATAPHLLGFVGLRGGVIAVFSLETLLGHTAVSAAPRWLALGAGRDAMAFGFGAMDGFFRVRQGEIHRDAPAPGRGAREYVQVGSDNRAIIDLNMLRETIKQRAGQAGRDKER
jgi:chemotaxis signal transduction protein